MSDDPPLGRSASQDALLEVVRSRGYRRSEQPFTLSSGGESHDYVDLRAAVSDGADLRLAAEAVLEFLAARGIEFDAIGGMTMGADPVAHAVAVVADRRWYSIRKAEKTYGTGKRIEGAAIGPGIRVVVFEDTTSTGRSLLDALDVVAATGAEVSAALTLLDRGADTPSAFVGHGVRFLSLLTYVDLGIEPIGRAGARR
jgi:orotate phosphoribosyltransferase